MRALVQASDSPRSSPTFASGSTSSLLPRPSLLHYTVNCICSQYGRPCEHVQLSRHTFCLHMLKDSRATLLCGLNSQCDGSVLTYAL